MENASWLGPMLLLVMIDWLGRGSVIAKIAITAALCVGALIALKHDALREDVALTLMVILTVLSMAFSVRYRLRQHRRS